MADTARPTVSDDPILGNAKILSKIDEHEVKGNLVGARPRYVRERWGEEGIADVAARLSEPERKLFLATTLPFNWYPMRAMAEIDRAIVLGPMRGDPFRMKDFGATIARYDLPTIYKVLFKVGSPAFVVRRIGVAYRTYIRGGSMRGETPTSASAIITLEGNLPKYLCTHGCAGWFSAAIELSGGRRVRVTETDCVHDGAKHCRWEAHWA